MQRRLRKMSTIRAMRRSIMVVDMEVTGSPRMRSRPLAMMLERELVLMVGGDLQSRLVTRSVRTIVRGWDGKGAD